MFRRQAVSGLRLLRTRAVTARAAGRSGSLVASQGAPVRFIQQDAPSTNGQARTPRPRQVGNLVDVSVQPDAVALIFSATGGQPAHSAQVPNLWLRDACQCPVCVNPSSGQKTFATSDIPPDGTSSFSLRVRSAKLAEDGSLLVEWENDHLSGGRKHESVYPAQFLSERIAARKLDEFGRPRIAWNRAMFEKRTGFISYADWMDGGEHFWRGLADLAQMGLIFLKDVPQSETAVEDIAGMIGHIQTTFYGKTWDVVSKPQAENVAYTSEFLGLHQDLLYMVDPPRIQLLHCLANEATGGESIFSDGLRAALEIDAESPATADILTKVHINYHYDKGDHSYHFRRPVLRRDRAGSFGRVFWSPPFQDTLPLNAPPLSTSSEGGDASSTASSGRGNGRVLTRWARAARVWSDKLSAPENQWEYKMQPGECVLFDNLRVMHGRRQFDTQSGHRWLKGTYISDQVFTSRLQRAHPASGLRPSGDQPHPSELEKKAVEATSS